MCPKNQTDKDSVMFRGEGWFRNWVSRIEEVVRYDVTMNLRSLYIL